MKNALEAWAKANNIPAKRLEKLLATISARAAKDGMPDLAERVEGAVANWVTLPAPEVVSLERLVELELV